MELVLSVAGSGKKNTKNCAVKVVNKISGCFPKTV